MKEWIYYKRLSLDRELGAASFPKIRNFPDDFKSNR